MSLLDDENIIALDSKDLIIQFIKENYKFLCTNFQQDLRFRKESNGYIVDYDGPMYLNGDARSLTGDLFEWGELGEFYCPYNQHIKDLKGAPKKCIRLSCAYCNNLRELGCIIEECDNISFYNCKNLRNFIGCPNKCESFNCSYCEGLESFDGIPKQIHQLNTWPIEFDPLKYPDVKYDYLI